ncbi:MAG: 3-hydroxyacyl-CoA dehydrogenase family protein [Actinomycetota bacterium]
MKPDEVKKVAVIGCGLMGSGITEVAAKSGMEVTFVEVSEEKCQKQHGRIEKSITKAVEKGKLSEDDGRGAIGRIAGTTDYGSAAEADLVIEAVSEDLDTKLEVFRTLDKLTRDDVVLASNTSSLPIGEMAAVTNRPDRVLGMHFFNPVPLMKLLELVRGLQTSDETLEFARGMGERLGKTVVVSKDRAGFIVNTLLACYLNMAVRMVEEGFASKEDIDAAVTLGLGHPMGPLTLLDLIGIDTAYAISDVLYQQFKDPIYSAPNLMKQMVTAGYHGRKTGKGFYDYGE